MTSPFFFAEVVSIELYKPTVRWTNLIIHGIFLGTRERQSKGDFRLDSRSTSNNGCDVIYFLRCLRTKVGDVDFFFFVVSSAQSQPTVSVRRVLTDAIQGAPLARDWLKNTPNNSDPTSLGLDLGVNFDTMYVYSKGFFIESRDGNLLKKNLKERDRTGHFRNITGRESPVP